MGIRLCGASLLLLMAALLSCDSSNTVRAIRIARYAQSESQRVLKEFLPAARDNDTTALKMLATQPVLRQIAHDHVDGRFLPDYSAAAASSRVEKVQVVLCGADVAFTYYLDGNPRNGLASIRYHDGVWRVTNFGLLVLY